jgi:hypothetical protein
VADTCIARWLCACLLFWSALAGAHPMPESLVWIDATATGLQLTARLPLRRLGFVFGLDNPLGQQTVLARDDEALAAYLLRHVGVRSGAASWQVLRPRMAMTGSGSAAALEAVFDVRAPATINATARRHLELVYDIITDEVRTHHVRVFLRGGWQAGLAGQPPLLLGELTHGRTTLPVTLAPPAATGVLPWFASGVLHIAQGADHLVFLLMLVLAVARLPRGAAVRRLAWAVAAFTLGHAAAMAAGSPAWFAVPLSTPLVEMAVALTIGLAALHAWRPLFARAEGWLALGCGIVHGLAGAGVAPWQHVQALLAFNLGIATMQALAVAAALPPLLVLAHRRSVWCGRLRLALAAAGGVLALAWIAMQLAPAGIDVSAWLERDTAPMMIMAVLWAVFLSALGTAQWRAWRAGRTASNMRPVALDEPPVRDDPPA